MPNGNFSHGQRLSAWDCHGGRNQRWTFVDGSVRTELWQCSGTANQKWRS